MHVVDADADEVTGNEDFTVFVRDHEARLRNALTARFGVEFGREAAAEALAYGWEHWDRVGLMDNPIGYLFVVGRDRGRTMAGRRRVLFPDVSQERASWVEPGLAAEGFSKPTRFHRDELDELTNEPGVHVVWDPDGQLIYVGHSGSQRDRVLQHLSGDREASILHKKVGDRLDKRLQRAASRDEIRACLERMTIAWKSNDNPQALTSRIVEELGALLNEKRATARLHLVLRWSPTEKADTIEAHRSIADSHGSVWWGKITSDPSSPAMGAKRLNELKRQLDESVETHVYLVGAGTVWRTTLTDLSTDPSPILPGERPDYYDVSECHLFVKLSNFTQLEWSFLETSLFLASSGKPVADSLGGQALLLYVHETSSKGSTMSDDWNDLADELLLPVGSLREIDSLLRDKRQVIFYGPPGTGKTFVAQALARHYARGSGDFKLVQFHPSYAYEDFVEGYRPVLIDGVAGFRVQDGPLKRIAFDASNNPEATFVLVIDEINRGKHHQGVRRALLPP